MKSRTQWPVGGWWFVDAPISDKPLGDGSWDHERLSQEVLARRKANPRFNLSTDINVIRDEVDIQNALRMLSIQGAESYIITDGGPSPNRAASRSLNWRDAVGGVKRVAAGAGALKDWLGEGSVPVPKTQATDRAAVCAVCPQNQPGDLTSWFTQPVAARIKAQVAMKQDLDLRTPYDEKLHICVACACPLELKVNVPLKHIADHLSDEVKRRLDKSCWILKEMA